MALREPTFGGVPCETLPSGVWGARSAQIDSTCRGKHPWHICASPNSLGAQRCGEKAPGDRNIVPVPRSTIDAHWLGSSTCQARTLGSLSLLKSLICLCKL